MDITKINGFKDYFEFLSQNKKDYIILICSRNNIGPNISDAQADLIRSSIGIKTDFSSNRGLDGNPWRGYFAVVDGGEIIAEELGVDKKTLRYRSQKLFIKSPVYTHATGVEPANISVDKVEHCVNKKGLNIVVIDKQTEKPIDSINFYISSETCGLNRAEVFSNKELSEAYDKFRNEFKGIDIPTIELYRPKYPYGECAVVHNALNLDGLSDFAKKEKMHFENLNQIAVISFDALNTDKNGVKYLFNGMTKWDDKLIYGSKDVESNEISAHDLKEGIGEFDLLVFDGETVECSTDYFGICKWYYYREDNGVFVAATSYHLLLLMLKSLNVSLRLNIKKASATMGFFSAIAETNFTEEMDVENCYELPPTFKLKFSADTGALVEKNSLHDAIESPESFSLKTYKSQLLLVKEDLISNMQVLLEHPKFDKVVIELSGGLDSRIILAAAMNLPEDLRRKIRITSYSSEVKSYLIASGIVNAYGLSWDDSEVKKEAVKSDLKKFLPQSPISHNLGNYWLSGSRERNAYLQKYESVCSTIYTTGIMGEVLYRPFYTWYNYERDIDRFAETLVSAVDIGRATNARKYFTHYIKETLESFSPAKLNEKMETHYLFYRNRHHCSKKYSSNPYWIPLQSKVAFDCRTTRYRLGMFDRKFAFDLLALLDPFLVKFPYENEVNNEYLREWGQYEDEELQTMASLEMEKAARLSRKVSYIPNKKAVIAFGKELMNKHESKETMLTALKCFLDYSEEFEEFGRPLYEIFIGARPSKEEEHRYQKLFVKGIRKRRIFSIYQQIKLIEDGCDSAM